MTLRVNLHGGTGIMGKVHKPKLESQGVEVTISGRKTDWVEAAKNSDVTIVSVPIPYTEETIAKVAPYCSAIMDLTSVKTMPLQWMRQYAPGGCEVGGLHPLYKIEGTTMVYCPTERTGPKTEMVVEAFGRSGLEIKAMSSKEHDIKVNGMQILRTRLLETFALVGINYTRDINDLYSTQTTQNKLLLDLIARQVDESNDELFYAMREFNPYVKEMEEFIEEAWKNPNPQNAKRIREFLGEGLKEAQNRAAKHLD